MNLAGRVTWKLPLTSMKIQEEWQALTVELFATINILEALRVKNGETHFSSMCVQAQFYSIALEWVWL